MGRPPTWSKPGASDSIAKLFVSTLALLSHCLCILHQMWRDLDLRWTHLEPNGILPSQKWSWFSVDNKCCTCHLTIKKWVGGQSASQLFNLRLKLFNYSRDCFYRALQREADARRSNGVGSAAAKSEGAESYYTTRNISRARGEPCSRYHYFILKQATGCGLSLNT